MHTLNESKIRPKGGTRTLPLGFAILGAAACVLAWAGVTALLADRLAALPDPNMLGGGSGGVMRVRFGEGWTAYAAPRWWGEATTIHFGTRSPVPIEPSGRPAYAARPGTVEDRRLLAAGLGPGAVVEHRAAGWPLRVWTSARITAGSAPPAVERRLLWAPAAASALLTGGAGFGVSWAGAALALRSWRSRTGAWRRSRGRCPACGYDRTGEHGVCPECGTDDNASPRPRSQR